MLLLSKTPGETAQRRRHVRHKNSAQFGVSKIPIVLLDVRPPLFPGSLQVLVNTR